MNHRGGERRNTHEEKGISTMLLSGVGRDVRRYRLRWGWEDGESLNPVSDTPVFVKEVF